MYVYLNPYFCHFMLLRKFPVSFDIFISLKEVCGYNYTTKEEWKEEGVEEKRNHTFFFQYRLLTKTLL